MQEKFLLTSKEASEFLGKKVTTLRVWRYKKIGPKWIKDPHGNIYYRINELNKWINSDMGA